MAQVIGAAADAAFAAGLREDVGDITNEAIVVVLSPALAGDTGAMKALYDAVDAGKHVVPVMLQGGTLPEVIGNLQALDFSTGYPREALRAALAAPHGLTMPALTPRKRANNRAMGALIGFIVVFMFIVGLIAVGELGIQMPREEYDAVDTQAAATQHYFIDPLVQTNLPRSTEQAQQFPATLQALPTRYRPFLALTATWSAANAGAANAGAGNAGAGDAVTPTPTP